MQLNVDDTALRAVMSEALLRALDDRTREALIKDALHYLITSEGGVRGVSPIQRAFREALSDVARKAAEEAVLNDPAVQAQIKAMVVEAWEQATGPGRQKIIDAMASTLGRALTGDRY